MSRQLRGLDENDFVLKILYQLSIEDAHKSLFSYSGTLSILMDIFIQSLNDETKSKEICSAKQSVDVTLVSLLVNLALNETNSEVDFQKTRLSMCYNDKAMGKDRFFELLIQTAISNVDAMMFKVRLRTLRLP